KETSVFECMRELSINKVGAIEEQPVKILAVLVSEVAIGSREIRCGSLHKLQLKTSVMSDSPGFIKPPQEIEFHRHSYVHHCGSGGLPRRRGSARRRAGEISIKGQWLRVVHERAPVRVGVVQFKPERRNGFQLSVLSCGTCFCNRWRSLFATTIF